MRANHVPVVERLESRISKLEALEDSVWIKGRRGNPYNRCRHCNVHTPEFSNRGYRHFNHCPYQGLKNEIRFYKKLLVIAKGGRLYLNSGETLGIVGVTPLRQDGRHVYLPARNPEFTWIRTRDLHLTAYEAEHAPVARYAVIRSNP